MKWNKAKADLRVTEGNRSCGKKKAACTRLLSTYNVLMLLR